MALRTGGQILADQLMIQGADMGFGVPGESYLALLDGLYNHKNFHFITCRMEAGAANMAVAYGKRTGRPGLCFVTRGPGATHASIGVHTAQQDSVPMILLVGQVARDMKEREAFQEIDYKAVFSTMAKWVVEIDNAKRIPEIISRAYSIALSGRPGPVVIALPEDMLTDEVDVQDGQKIIPAEPAPSSERITDAIKILEASKRPLIVVGGFWSAKASTMLEAFAMTHKIPVAAGFRSQDVMSNAHNCYVGDLGLGPNPKLKDRFGQADVILALGTRLEENVSGSYSYFNIPVPQTPLIHAHPDTNELNRVYTATVPIASTMQNVMEALNKAPIKTNPAWEQWCKQARADYDVWQNPEPHHKTVLDMTAVMQHIRQKIPQGTIICNGAGNYAIWVHRFLRYTAPQTQLAPTSGAMGFGLPAAVAAALIEPDSEVLSFNGDGCFLMCGQELATAVQYKANFTALIVNNGWYGTIKMHQAREYPGRTMATQLINPDFTALARSFGAFAERVTRTEDFAAAFEHARAYKGPSVLEMIVDPDIITPAMRLSEMESEMPS